MLSKKSQVLFGGNDRILSKIGPGRLCQGRFRRVLTAEQGPSQEYKQSSERLVMPLLALDPLDLRALLLRDAIAGYADTLPGPRH